MPNGDAEELRRALETHSVAGYPVRVPVFEKGTIIRQHATSPVRMYQEEEVTGIAGPMVYFDVKPARKFPFKKYVAATGKSAEPMTIDQWKQKYERGARTIYNVIPSTKLVNRLEKGGKVSEAEAAYEMLKGRGQLDEDDNVLFDIFWPNQTTVAPEDLEPGMLVQFSEQGKPPGWPGRIVGFTDGNKVALLELFTPTAYMEVPDAVANESVKKGYYSSKTFALGYGVSQALEDQGRELPPGKWSDDERQYVLKEWMDISVVEELCRQHYPDEPHCLWQSLLFYIVPLHLDGQYTGTFHPLPEKVIPAEWIIRYEDIGEFMPPEE